MTDELVKRLRSMHWCVTTEANGVGVSDRKVASEAADRIETSEEQNLRLWGMVHDLRKEVAISDALLISEAEASLARLARAEKAEAERDRLREALVELVQQTHNCERELTEDLHHVDFCGESVPLTNAREALKGGGHE